MPFGGSVEVREQSDPPDGRRWMLLAPLTYHGKDEVFEVQAGFTTDFASVPFFLTWLVPRYGRFTKAAILHDHLWKECRDGRFEWADADGILRRAMRELNVPFLRRWFMWGAVRLASIFGHHDYSSLRKQGAATNLALAAVTCFGVAFAVVPSLVVIAFLAVFWLAEGVAWVLLKLLTALRRTESSKQVNPPRVFLRP